MVTVAYINRMTGRIPLLAKIARAIHNFCWVHNIRISATHECRSDPMLLEAYPTFESQFGSYLERFLLGENLVSFRSHDSFLLWTNNSQFTV